jgi:hypothetical protein
MKEVTILKKQLSVSVSAAGRSARASAIMCGLAIILVAALVPVESHAASEEMRYNGFPYIVKDGKVHIFCDDDNNFTRNDAITIPGKINKMPVVSIELVNVVCKSISFNQCTQLQRIYMEGVFSDKINLSKAGKLQSLRIDESGSTTNLNLNGCKALTQLHLSIESLKKLSVSSCTKLKELLVSHTDLRSINLSKCAALREIYIEGQKVEGITLGEKRSLKILLVNDNGLKSLNISKCPALEELDFSYNAGLSVNISKNRKLKKVTFSPKELGGNSRTINNPLKTFPKVFIYKNG